MQKTSIATVSLSGDLQEKLDAIAAAGFAAVEIFENDFLAFPAGAAEVGRMVADRGLAVSLFQPFRDFEGLPQPQRRRAFERAERKFDVMQALGTDLLLVCSSVSPEALGGIDRAAADLRELGERAAARGLRIGYEALAWGRHVFDHRDAWEVVRRADHPAVGLILDSFHSLARGIDGDSIRRIPGDRIFLVQLADAPRLEMDLLSWSRHFRNMPGQGDLDVVGFLAAVQATGYRGYLSLEIFNDQFRAGSARTVAIDGQRSLLLANERVAQRSDAAEAVADGPALPTLPARQAPLGTEFIEFAVDEEAARRLASLFRSLGFVRSGRHVSKEVERWSQGAINLVINLEREGFAHASYLTHGPSVCAIGLRVPDARAVRDRARALLAQPFSQPVGSGERELPAIRGVGGSLIYLVEARDRGIWDVDFRAVQEPPPDLAEPPRDAGLLAVDHISQSMEYDEMLSWLLFYTAVFEMQRTPELDIADPGGLVRSQVVQTADGAVRIPLNGTQSHRTMSGRFLSEFFGSGVQHVAFLSRDLLATGRALRANGVPLLEIPDNYYDDLEVRLGLERSFVERLRELGVLYDRDERGEYLQLYTQAFDERFFFEFVERRGGYRGFGAANAAIRLAVQSRSARAA